MATLPETKVCGECGVEKPRSEYWLRRDLGDGLYWRCKPCQREYNRVWWWKLDRREYLRRTARRTAKKRFVPFDLTADDIVIPEKCPVFGRKLDLTRKGPWSPSLDRIEPKKGYVRGNVIVVSWRANQLKGDATINELQTLANFYSNVKGEGQHHVK